MNPQPEGAAPGTEEVRNLAVESAGAPRSHTDNITPVLFHPQEVIRLFVAGYGHPALLGWASIPGNDSDHRVPAILGVMDPHPPPYGQEPPAVALTRARQAHAWALPLLARLSSSPAFPVTPRSAVPVTTSGPGTHRHATYYQLGSNHPVLQTTPTQPSPTGGDLVPHTQPDQDTPAPDHPGVTLLARSCGDVLLHLTECRQGRSDLSQVPWLEPDPRARGDTDPQASWQTCQQAALQVIQDHDDPAVPLLTAVLAYRPLREVYASPQRAPCSPSQNHSHRRAMLQPLGFRATRDLEHTLRDLAQAIADSSSPGLMQALSHLRDADVAIRKERDRRYNTFNDSTWTRIREDHLHGHESQAHNDLLSWSSIQDGCLAFGHTFQDTLIALDPTTTHDLDQVCTGATPTGTAQPTPAWLLPPGNNPHVHQQEQPIVHAFQAAAVALRGTPGQREHSLERHLLQAGEELSQILADPVARMSGTQETQVHLSHIRQQLTDALQQGDHPVFAQAIAQMLTLHQPVNQQHGQEHQEESP